MKRITKKEKAVRILSLIAGLMVMGVVFAVITAGFLFWHFSRGLPNIITVADYRPLAVTKVMGTKAGQPTEMGEFYKERRYLIPYNRISQNAVRAFISAEDDKFFEHSGFNLTSIIRAGIANFKAGHVVQGGSTITQQVAKSLLLSPEKSIDRKIKEVILASRIEKNLTKEQILYLYLNQIYLGHGAYGVEAASRTYYRKDAASLSLAEAALLAGLPQAPSKYSPILNPKRAKERQLYVLRRMFENKFITEAESKEAAQQRLKIYHAEELNNQFAPYWIEHVRRYLVEQYGEKAVYEDGLTVVLPASVEAALAATKSVQEGLRAVDKRVGFRGVISHLNGELEIEKFLKTSRLKLIEDKVQYQLLLADGRMDLIEAMHFAGIKSDLELIQPGKLYQAVVTGFEAGQKTAKLMIGALPARLTVDHLKWAKPPQGLASGLFKTGDVIWVSPTLESFAFTGPHIGKELDVQLEQEPQIQGSLLSLDVHTGYVTAMVGGYDYEQSEFNRVTQASRQLGSVFKPIIYASALEKGFTPTTIIQDSPIVFRDSQAGTSWKPNNFEEKFYGDTTFRQALIKSRNIPTIKIVQAVQIPYLIQYAKRLGLTAQFNSDLSISLGSGSTTLLDLTRVYALFPRLGSKVSPIFIKKIVDRDGKVLEDHPPQLVVVSTPPAPPAPVPVIAGSPPVPALEIVQDPNQLMDPKIAYVMTHLMTEVVSYGTGSRAQGLGKPAAGKTGTTNDYIDGWFVGFTPHILTSVWVGFDSQKTIGPGETGAKVALPIWLDYMKAVVQSEGDAEFPVPPGIVFAPIDPTSGRLVPASNASAIQEAFVEGTQPSNNNDPRYFGESNQSEFFKEDRD